MSAKKVARLPPPPTSSASYFVCHKLALDSFAGLGFVDLPQNQLQVPTPEPVESRPGPSETQTFYVLAALLQCSHVHAITTILIMCECFLILLICLVLSTFLDLALAISDL